MKKTIGTFTATCYSLKDSYVDDIARIQCCVERYWDTVKSLAGTCLGEIIDDKQLPIGIKHFSMRNSSFNPFLHCFFVISF